jgi:hypothetical protein
MNRSAPVALALFVGLSIVAAALFIAASATPDALARAILAQMGAAVFGSGLTVFLLRLLSTTDHA